MPSAFSFTEQIARCNLCGSTRLASVAAEANVVECLDCGYRFVTPRPSQSEIASSYSESDFYDDWIEAEAGRSRMWQKRLAVLKRAGRKVRLLDIGAGIGTFLAMARDQFGWDVTGTEVSTSAIRIARERYGLDLRLGRAEDLQLAGSFDLITLWHVLEHVPFPAQTLDLCQRLLVPNGLLAIAVPNDGDARRWLVRAKALLSRKAPPPRYQPLRPHAEVHLSQFNSRVLVNALRSRSFAVELAAIDDQYARPTFRSEALVRAYRVIQSVTGLAFGQAILLLARKKAT